MTIDIFKKVITYIKLHQYGFILISGGEPTEHPNFITIAELTQQSGLYAIILSNGTFLADPILRAKILSLGIPI